MQISRQSDKLSPQSSNKCWTKWPTDGWGIFRDRRQSLARDESFKSLAALNYDIVDRFWVECKSRQRRGRRWSCPTQFQLVSDTFHVSCGLVYRKTRTAREVVSIFRTNADLFKQENLLFCSRNLEKMKARLENFFTVRRKCFLFHIYSQHDNFNLCKHSDSSLTFTDIVSSFNESTQSFSSNFDSQ